MVLFYTMSPMKSIDLFEVKGFEVDTAIDVIILDIHKKNPEIRIKKIDVLDRIAMKKHKDVVKILKEKDVDVLPIIKVDNKIVSQEKFESLARRVL